jgi:Protein of unknown function (DUF402)
MPGESDETVPFPVGATVVRRDMLGGKVWTATPNRLVADSGQDLVLACWPGVQMLAPTKRIEWLLTGADEVRNEGIHDLAAGLWDLGPWTWRDSVLLSRFRTGDYFSVHQFSGDSNAREPAQWYVNFELPFGRTAIGIDTCDLLLDLVVDVESLRYRWKDEDEYAQGRRLGLIGDHVHARIDDARQEVMALIESREGPFAEDWSAWQPSRSWRAPRLPADALSVPANPGSHSPGVSSRRR